MKPFIFFLFTFFFPALMAQQDLSLESVVDSAIAYHPRSQDMELLRKINQNKIDNNTVNWYPEISLNGQASYQSDVVEINIDDSPFNGLDFPTAPKDQYKAYIDINQTLYDAGRTRKQKEIENLSLQSSLLETEKDIEKVKSSVIEIFYRILILQENLKILKLSLDQIDENIDRVQAAIDNGIALSSDIELLKVERLDIQQQIENLDRQKESAASMLSSLCGMSISPTDNFNITHLTMDSLEINRKELKLLRQNKQVLGKSYELTESARLPVAFAFGQFGYGNPGLNLLNDAFDTYYIVGVGFRWEIWDWSRTNRTKTNIEYQRGLIENKEKEFIESIERAKMNQQSIIENHQENIQNYQQILALREKITQTYENKLSEGTITSLDLLNVTNQERIMRIKLNNEKILLQKSIAEFKLLTGNF
ncbi:MAG: TolC family protein [Bacteroidales bacterium]